MVANDGFTFLSYGGGQDSTAILFRIIYDEEFRKKYVRGRLLVGMAETGNEHASTYKYLDYIQALCEMVDIEFIRIPLSYAAGNWQKGLIGFYKAKNAVGSKAFPKTCTDQLKIRPIYRFLEEYIHHRFQTQKYGRKAAFYEYTKEFGKVRVLLGIAKGEEKRASENGSSGQLWFDRCVDKMYPLLDMGMDRQACQDYIKQCGGVVPMPSNCILCPFMSLQELLYLYRYEHRWYCKWVELEQNKFEANQHKGDKNLGVWGSTKTLEDMLIVADEKHGHMTKDDLIDYKMSHGHCVMSKY